MLLKYVGWVIELLACKVYHQSGAQLGFGPVEEAALGVKYWKNRSKLQMRVDVTKSLMHALQCYQSFFTTILQMSTIRQEYPYSLSYQT
mmetsp:Transcript_8376/g.52343  ORF Transcript_8376/g.52343 Transcript_8376/m.52343 type:complete len:89 (+) Transcript_8376:2500-2766(+)